MTERLNTIQIMTIIRFQLILPKSNQTTSKNKINKFQIVRMLKVSKKRKKKIPFMSKP